MLCSPARTVLRFAVADVAKIFQRHDQLLIVALIAGILGFGGIAGAAVGIAKIVFFVAIVLFLISLLFGGYRGFGRL